MKKHKQVFYVQFDAYKNIFIPINHWNEELKYDLKDAGIYAIMSLEELIEKCFWKEQIKAIKIKECSDCEGYNQICKSYYSVKE